jgi:hypothetical protein
VSWKFSSFGIGSLTWQGSNRLVHAAGIAVFVYGVAVAISFGRLEVDRFPAYRTENATGDLMVMLSPKGHEVSSESSSSQGTVNSRRARRDVELTMKTYQELKRSWCAKLRHRQAWQ